MVKYNFISGVKGVARRSVPVACAPFDILQPPVSAGYLLSSVAQDARSVNVCTNLRTAAIGTRL